MTRNELIDQIVQHEWQMFTTTRSAGGRASCQDDQATFQIMRTSQMNVWREDTLEHYLHDLTEAEGQHRNLIEEKYAWMMASTHPAEFRRLAPLLPTQSAEKKEIIEHILAHQMKSLEDMRPLYPQVLASMRHLHTSEDTPSATSFETYQRGELYTYSFPTLQCFERQVMEMADYGLSVLEGTARQYGFSSLDALENALASQGQ